MALVELNSNPHHIQYVNTDHIINMESLNGILHIYLINGKNVNIDVSLSTKAIIDIKHAFKGDYHDL